MKIIAISDTHCKHNAITQELLENYNEFPDSILIHAGDCCLDGNRYEAIDFLNWFGDLPFKTKILVPGNHDCAFEHSFFRIDYLELEELAKSKNINIVINDIFTINGIKFLCNSNIPKLRNWAFYAEDETRQRFFEFIDQNADIVISHTPPYGVLDEAPRGYGTFEHVGCKHLRNYIDRNNTKIVINGHIHECYGEQHYKDTKVYNCSILDGHYMSFNPITKIIID